MHKIKSYFSTVLLNILSQATLRDVIPMLSLKREETHYLFLFSQISRKNTFFFFLRPQTLGIPSHLRNHTGSLIPWLGTMKSRDTESCLATSSIMYLKTASLGNSSERQVQRIRNPVDLISQSRMIYTLIPFQTSVPSFFIFFNLNHFYLGVSLYMITLYLHNFYSSLFLLQLLPCPLSLAFMLLICSWVCR